MKFSLATGIIAVLAVSSVVLASDVAKTTDATTALAQVDAAKDGAKDAATANKKGDKKKAVAKGLAVTNETAGKENTEAATEATDKKIAKDTTTALSPELVPTADSNVVKALTDQQCLTLNATTLNALKDVKAMAGFSPECLKSFVVTGVEMGRLENLTKETLAALDKKTVGEIVDSDIVENEMTEKVFAGIIGHIDPATVPAHFTGLVVRRDALLELLMATKNGKLVGAFLTADNLASMPTAKFAKLNKTVVEVLPKDAFSKISAERLANIPAAAFAGFTEDHVKTIAPASLALLTKAQADQLSDKALGSFTVGHVARFGADPLPQKPSAHTADKKVLGLEALDRKTFTQNHPCQTIQSRKDKMSPAVYSAFAARCNGILAAGNSASALIPSSLALLLVLVSACFL